MPMTQAQIEAELLRKKKLGVQPDDPNNKALYDKLTVPGAPNQPAPSLGQDESYIRKSLTGQGYKDTDIGWDAGRKMVTLQGQDFLSPVKSINGSGVASNDSIANALSKFRNTETIKKQNDLMSRLEQAINTPYAAPEFKYDPNTDPVYQAALQRAQANAQTATGNAMAEMNRRGLLNSTIMGDRAAQIQQGEFGRVSDEILPQLFQQAYQRHRDTVGDQYTQSRNTMSDLGNLLGMTSDLNQRRIDNENTDRQFNRGVLESDRAYEYQKARDAIADERYKLEFDEDVRRFGLDYALRKAETNNQISNRNAQTALDRERLELQKREMDLREKEASKRTEEENKALMQEEVRALTNGLRSGEITPESALKQISEDLSFGFYTPEQADQLKKIVTELTPSTPSSQPRQLTDDELATIPSEKDLERLYEEQGKPKGYAKLDWQQWYRDPRGRIGGVDFPTWKALYGPKLQAK